MILLLKPITDFLAAQTADEGRQAWEGGPTAPYKKVRGVPVADFVKWIKAVEDSPALRGESSKVLVQRIRRVLYGVDTDRTTIGQTGVIADDMCEIVTDRTVPPLTTAHVAIDVLNGLYGTDTIRTASGAEVDLSHLWIPADVTLNGTRVGLHSLASAKLGLITWTGDLGTAIRNFIGAIGLRAGPLTAAQKNQAMLQSLNEEALKEDLLGDIDAVVLSKWLAALDSFVLSAEIERYYKDDEKTQAVTRAITRPKSARRFHWFVNLATEPKIPGSGKSALPVTGPLDVTLDTAQAVDDLKEVLITATAELTKRVELGVTTDLDRFGGEAQFDLLIDKFVNRFLKNGLLTGDGEWPGPW